MRRTVLIVIQHGQGQRQGQGQRRVIDIDIDVDLGITSYYLSTNTSYHVMLCHFTSRHVTVCDAMLRCCGVLYCIVLYCIVLYCIVLYCIVLYCVMSNHFCAHKMRKTKKREE